VRFSKTDDAAGGKKTSMKGTDSYQLKVSFQIDSIGELVAKRRLRASCKKNNLYFLKGHAALVPQAGREEETISRKGGGH